MDTPVRSFDANELRQVLGTFFTGVTVITTIDSAGRPHGLTANSFNSVSLDPPLILWSQSRAAPSHPTFRACSRFAVNILAEDQIDISKRFARGGIDKFAGVGTHAGEHGMPLIDGCAAWIECRLVDTYPGGDHVVFMGEVEHIARHGRQPLLFGDGRYRVAQPHEVAATGESRTHIARLQAVRLATRALVELSDELDETLGLGVWGNKGPTIVRWEESRRPVSENLCTGLVLPVLSSVTGLAFAAWLPRELTAPLVDAELQQDADNLGVDREWLPRRLAEIRAAGFACIVGSDGFAGLYGTRISAVSVPVFDANGDMVLAATSIGAGDRLDTASDGRLVVRLRACARDLSAKLGWGEA
jgi:flavin reductase (DIM6/NTAB) family NADH-FMN oxidoreductase RutF